MMNFFVLSSTVVAAIASEAAESVELPAVVPGGEADLASKADDQRRRQWVNWANANAGTSNGNSFANVNAGNNGWFWNGHSWANANAWTNNGGSGASAGAGTSSGPWIGRRLEGESLDEESTLELTAPGGETLDENERRRQWVNWANANAGTSNGNSFANANAGNNNGWFWNGHSWANANAWSNNGGSGASAGAGTSSGPWIGRRLEGEALDEESTDLPAPEVDGSIF